MDKGIEKIKNLEARLNELRKQESQNNDKIMIKNIELMEKENEIGSVNYLVGKLKGIKYNIERKQELLKEHIKDILIIIGVAVLLGFPFGMLVGAIRSYFFKPEFVIMSPLQIGLVAAVLGAGWNIISSSIKFRKQFGNKSLDEIEKELSEKNNELNFKLGEKKQLEIELTGFTDISNAINVEMEKIVREIERINNVRSGVIKEYCKENSNSDNNKKLQQNETEQIQKVNKPNKK